jgi:hypothetical protein
MEGGEEKVGGKDSFIKPKLKQGYSLRKGEWREEKRSLRQFEGQYSREEEGLISLERGMLVEDVQKHLSPFVSNREGDREEWIQERLLYF